MLKVVQNTDIAGIKVSELFSLIKDMGFDGIDYLTHIKDFYRTPKKILRLSESYNLPILSLHQPKAFIPYHPKIFFRKMIRLLEIFPSVQVSNYHLSGFINLLRKKPSAVSHFIQLAKKHQAVVSFESNPHVLTSLQIYPKETYDPTLFAQFCLKNSLPITVDTSHIADNGYNVARFFRKYSASIAMIHLSDFYDNIQHLPLGVGELPLGELFREIKKVSWSGVIVFEIKRFPGAISPFEKAQHLKKSLDLVRKYT